ncbi:hypothetical protein BP6252_08589 [Coleophoma cylindrospora]|uniref:Nephrocystin 3-like N-terminal domain-containing protein n=1 Tax=Coleophoma cylindrospora TaxID=1849047 RepID=A0A3D8R698_9HELO|nr:hypothetical protein BP6252_08589 [Coleophoma cylindrospora]
MAPSTEKALEQAINAIFNGILDTFHDTDSFGREDSPTIFIVYAHHNSNVAGKAAGDHISTELIDILKRVGSRTFSDRYPSERVYWSSRDSDAFHNIIGNQSIILPKSRSEERRNKVHSSDKVILCWSEMLEEYYKDEGMKKYIEAIKIFYNTNGRHLRRNDNDKLKDELKKITATYSKDNPVFHHVLTEMAFLEIRYEEMRHHGIVPVQINGDGDLPKPEFLGNNTDLWQNPPDVDKSLDPNENVIHKKKRLHLWVFKLLKKLFVDFNQQIRIDEFEACYKACIAKLEEQQEPSSDITSLPTLKELEDWPDLKKNVVAKITEAFEKISRAHQRAQRTAPTMGNKDRAEQNQEIRRLPVAEASFNDDKINRDKRVCLENTRVRLLQEIEDWSVDDRGERIFWLNGLAGTGKSTIAMTVCKRLNQKGRLGASYFFSTQQNGGSSREFFTTLASDLANVSVELRTLISNAIADHHDFAKKTFQEQWRWLVLEPLKKYQSSGAPLVLVIDALDECVNERDAKDILDLLGGDENPHLILRILITSRPEVPGFDSICNYTRRVDLHNIQDTEKDILLYLNAELSRIRASRKARADWPDKTKVAALAQKAGDLFIYAATACRFIDVDLFYDKRLTSILKEDRIGMKSLHEIYMKILETAIPDGILEEERNEAQEDLNEIVAMVLVLFKPLSIRGLRKFLPRSITFDEVQGYLRRLGSIIAVSGEDSQVRIYHLSFRDFFLNIKREDKTFWASEPEVHRSLVSRCLQVMSEILKMDVCNVRESDYHSSRINQDVIKKCLPEHVQYACRYWIPHLEQSDNIPHDEVLVFLQGHFLHWLEALSIMGLVSEGVLMINKLYNMANLQKKQELFDLSQK